MLSPSQADELIGQHVTCLPIESLPLAQCAGAVLRENIYAERDQPPFDRVAMDGIALDSNTVQHGTRRLRIQATQAAGDPPLALATSAACIEVMTGAVIPSGCDSVVPVEQITVHSSEAELSAGITVEPWQNVHRRGTDTRQGALLLATGLRLQAPEIAIAASAGMARIRVSSQPMVAVISTGNELIEPGEPILPHQVRRSNAYAIAASLRRHGFQRVADDHLPDEPMQLKRRLKFHLETHDVLVMSGGVSMGKLDFVPRVLDELGVQTIFHKIMQRPGLPMWFGTTGSGATVFALPGNPVSTLICLTRYVLPALFTAMGEAPLPAERMALGGEIKVKSPHTRFMPAKVEVDDWGRAWAMPRPTNGSGDFTSLGGTDGFVEMPPGPHTYPKGFVTRLHRW
ncbi:MAG TPA: molybdopterin molybdotransferase MoeA [Steroidobacteraceae bacterium]